MNVERFVDEIAGGVHREVVCRKALRAILDEAEASIEGDRNPNKGDLMRISRMAYDALKETDIART